MHLVQNNYGNGFLSSEWADTRKVPDGVCKVQSGKKEVTLGSVRVGGTDYYMASVGVEEKLRTSVSSIDLLITPSTATITPSQLSCVFMSGPNFKRQKHRHESRFDSKKTLP